MDNATPSYKPPQSSEIFNKISKKFGSADRVAHQELLGWTRIGIAVLALAGVMAFLVAVSRIPNIEQLQIWPIDFFQKGLVVHVIFSFIVWFFAVYGALLCLFIATSSSPNISRFIIALSILASTLLAIPAFLSDSTASLNNYVPTIMNPVFYVGLILLALALVTHTLRFLYRVFKGGFENLFGYVISAAAIIFLLALASLFIAGGFLRESTITQEFNENLFWGFGHIIQFTNVAMLIAAWIYLANISEIQLNAKILKLSVSFLIIAAFCSPLFYFLYEPFSAAQNLAFTNLQYVFAPVTCAVLFVFLFPMNKFDRPLPWKNPAFLTLMLSIFVFCIGGTLGLFVDGADTRTPAHYHGVIAGINLAFMGLYYALFLPLLDRAIPITKIIYVQIYMFAGGQSLASIGLFMAGGYGVPRKVAGSDQSLEAIGAYAGMVMNGVGALIAIIGGILFIWSMAKALLSPPKIS